jgi:hypothetical protein
VRLYSASSEATVRAGKLLTDWAGEGFLTKAQYQLLEQETVSDLRTTNIFLRLVLFLFALIAWPPPRCSSWFFFRGHRNKPPE